MSRVTDVRPKPGDIVIVRGGKNLTIFRDPGGAPRDNSNVAGVVGIMRLGIVISTHATTWTYVMWSNPTVLGWVMDGNIRTIKI